MRIMETNKKKYAGPVTPGVKNDLPNPISPAIKAIPKKASYTQTHL